MDTTRGCDDRVAKQVRSPVVAGTFYPSDPMELRAGIAAVLREANADGPLPKALIVPHAGFRYSGAIAASGYALLDPDRQPVRRVVLLGPAHRAAINGLAASSADAFETPLGSVPLDRAGIDAALKLPQVKVRNDVHVFEHSLEVQLAVSTIYPG